MNICRMMLTIGFCASLFAATPLSANPDTTDQLGVPGPVLFDGESYNLGWTARQPSGYIKQEYVPQGQNPKTYGSMVLLEYLPGDMTPQAAASAQMKMLEARKGSDPLVNMDLILNRQSGEVVLDFIMSSKDAKGEYIVEWNAYRYMREPKGLVLYGVSHRAYGNDNAKAFLSDLKTLCKAQIDSLATATVPKVTPAP